MSREAQEWAWNQDVADPAAKLVLLVLANWADPLGAVQWVNYDNIGKFTRVSKRSLFRIVAGFEKAGVFARDVVYAKSGAPKVSGRLFLDRNFGPSETPADCGAAESDDFRECQSGTTLPSEGGVVPELWHEGSATAGTPYIDKPDSEREYNPTTTQLYDREEASEDEAADDSAPISDSPETETPLRRDWSAFKSAYPFLAWMSLDAAHERFAGLNAADRAKAVRWAAILRRDCEKHGKKHPMDAVNWLRKREFDRDAPLSAGANGGAVFVKAGTRAWLAWREHFDRLGKTHPALHGTMRAKSPDGIGDGWCFPSMWPPGLDPPAPS